MFEGYSAEEYTIIGITIVIGLLVGWLLNYLYSNRQIRKQDEGKTKKENDMFLGRMNTTVVKKNRVLFSPEICENEVSKANYDAETHGNGKLIESDEDEAHKEESGDEDEEEEEQMPQFNYRKIKSTEKNESGKLSASDNKQFPKDFSDCDKINATIGKLHGKLATAQLKAKTRQIAAEMSEEEKKYEAQMKNNQMESIMRLMMQNQEKFGMSSEDIKEQMNLYNF